MSSLPHIDCPARNPVHQTEREQLDPLSDFPARRHDQLALPIFALLFVTIIALLISRWAYNKEAIVAPAFIISVVF